MLDAKVILSNFFGSPKFSETLKGDAIKKQIIEKCSVFIANNLPGYVVCDLSDESIYEATEDGNFEYDFKDENFKVKHQFDRNIYNNYYPQRIVTQIEEIIDCFLERELYKEHITPVKTLVS